MATKASGSHTEIEAEWKRSSPSFQQPGVCMEADPRHLFALFTQYLKNEVRAIALTFTSMDSWRRCQQVFNKL